MPHNMVNTYGEKYAEVIVRVGLNVQPGQKVIVQFDQHGFDMLPHIATEAYKAGAALVIPIFVDNTMLAIQAEHGTIFDERAENTIIAPGIENAFRDGAARLVLISEDSSALTKAPGAKIAQIRKINSKSSKGLVKLLMSTHSNWCIAAVASPAWAKKVYRGFPLKNAVDLLWSNILNACRIESSESNAVEDWKKHNAILKAKSTFMNENRFDALWFKSPEGTDLTIGLAVDHIWKGGQKITKSGIPCNSNLPTEEIFTTPHRMKVHGVAKITRPMNIEGISILNAEFVFENGRIVEAKADKGQNKLRELLRGRNADRLGEVALVPASSRIGRLLLGDSDESRSFHSILFDENAASHIAIGQSYSHCMDGEDNQEMRGANQADIHLDWMIGSNTMDVWGIKDGKKTQLMSSGEWCF